MPQLIREQLWSSDNPGGKGSFMPKPQPVMQPKTCLSSMMHSATHWQSPSSKPFSRSSQQLLLMQLSQPGGTLSTEESSTSPLLEIYLGGRLAVLVRTRTRTS